MADYGDLPQPPPAPAPTPITIRVVQDLPPPPPPNDTGDPTTQPEQSSEKSNKHDEFYRYWDRFLSEEPTGKNTKTRRRNGNSKNIVSLDSDLEGRPAHLTRRNTEGIEIT